MGCNQVTLSFTDGLKLTGIIKTLVSSKEQGLIPGMRICSFPQAQTVEHSASNVTVLVWFLRKTRTDKLCTWIKYSPLQSDSGATKQPDRDPAEEVVPVCFQTNSGTVEWLNQWMDDLSTCVVLSTISGSLAKKGSVKANHTKKNNLSHIWSGPKQVNYFPVHLKGKDDWRIWKKSEKRIRTFWTQCARTLITVLILITKVIWLNRSNAWFS